MLWAEAAYFMLVYSAGFAVSLLHVVVAALGLVAGLVFAVLPVVQLYRPQSTR